MYANATNAVAGGDVAASWWSADVDADSIDRTQKFMKASAEAGAPFYINLWLHMSHDTIDPRPEWYNTTVKRGVTACARECRIAAPG